MPINSEKFKNALYKPLSREEVIAHIEGKGTTRPPFCASVILWRPDLLEDKEKDAQEAAFMDLYPEDVVTFEYTRPKNFGKVGEYCWIDVPEADPKLHRDPNITIGIDEETACSWEVINQIKENTPDPWQPESLVENWEEDDGRYRMIFWTRCTFERIWHYRGMENTLLDFYLEPENLKALLRKLVVLYKKVIDRASEEYHFDALAMTDDIGTQERPFFSEAIFIEFIKPVYKEVFEYAHSKGMHVWLHTCGNIEPFIPHMIEVGLDVLHPIQKYTMDEKTIRDKYADQICFWAGMDVQRTMPFGTSEEVREETRYLIDNYYLPGKGRLVLGPGNRMTVADISAENVEAFMDEARAYGLIVAEKQAVGEHLSPFLEKEKAYQ